jgi:hypothetical protein
MLIYITRAKYPKKRLSTKPKHTHVYIYNCTCNMHTQAAFASKFWQCSHNDFLFLSCLMEKYWHLRRFANYIYFVYVYNVIHLSHDVRVFCGRRESYLATICYTSFLQWHFYFQLYSIWFVVNTCQYHYNLTPLSLTLLTTDIDPHAQ